MKINSIKILKHPIFSKTNIVFQSKQFNYPADNIVIAGENGTGKTIFLETIYYISRFEPHPLYQDVEVEVEFHLSPHEAHALSLLCPEFKSWNNTSKNINLRVLLENSKIKLLIDNYNLMKLSDESLYHLRKFIGVIYCDTPNLYILNDKKNIKKNIFRQNYFTHSLKVSEQNKVNIKQMLSFELSDYLKRVKNDFFNKLERESKNVRTSNIPMLYHNLNRSFNLIGVPIKLLNRKNEISIEKNNKKLIFENLSSGETRLLQLSSIIQKQTSITGTPLLIDEPELGFHPYWQQRLLDFLAHSIEGRPQMLVSTHSPYIVHNQFAQGQVNLITKRLKNAKIKILNSNLKYPYYTGEDVAVKAFDLTKLIKHDHRLLIIVEGRSDEIYIGKVIKARQLSKFLEVQWVGKIDKKSGQESFTGSSALDSLKKGLSANPNLFHRKICLVYDCDQRNIANKKVCRNLYQFRFNPVDNPNFEKGIENLLCDVEDFLVLKNYISVKSFHDKNSGEFIRNVIQVNKIKLAKKICSLRGKHFERCTVNISKEIDNLIQFCNINI